MRCNNGSGEVWFGCAKRNYCAFNVQLEAWSVKNATADE